ncbi:hypothetical protein A5782_03340 [Mycobacterium sp. 852002-40037_SCH5390672]|nr:hypothetical protein A5782_03340 [Mycobacterium sp. 852002-40037_SCH5390672]
MWCHHNETRVFEEFCIHDAVIHRAITDGFQHRPHVGTDQARILQFRRHRCAAERLERPHTAPHQLVDHPGDQAVR